MLGMEQRPGWGVHVKTNISVVVFLPSCGITTPSHLCYCSGRRRRVRCLKGGILKQEHKHQTGTSPTEIQVFEVADALGLTQMSETELICTYLHNIFLILS